jgi:hypothetical protein
MSIVKKAVLATVLLAGFAAPSFAQQTQWSESGGNMHDLRAMSFSPDGKVTMGNVRQNSVGDLMKSAKPIGGNTLIFRHEGKFYMMENASSAPNTYMQ